MEVKLAESYEDFVKNSLPLVSIIVPCRNEEKFISRCLGSIVANTYPKDKLEVLVVDGMSEDRTRRILQKYAREYSFLRILNNPKKITPCALNSGIKDAKGELIIWMSAHSEYEKGYILKCIKYIEEFHIDAVGGIIKPISRNNSLIGKSICTAISHPFGVGSSAHKTGTGGTQLTDTAFGVCYKKEIFQKIGLFNEKLIRGQDMEFSLRMKKAGLKILLVPEIMSYYCARSSLKSFAKHNFTNGVWAILPFRYTNIIPISLRHLIPLIFILSLVGSLILSLSSGFFWWVFLGIILSYGIVNLYFSFRIGVKEKDLGLLFVMPAAFTIFHFSYGLGSVLGLAKCIFSRNFWKNLRTMLSGAE